VGEKNLQLNFEHEILPHLDSAYNLARWLTRNEHDAQDVVQEAYMRAFRFFGQFRGGNARAWLLRIVRNTCYTWLHRNRPDQLFVELDDSSSPPDPFNPDVEATLVCNERAMMLRHALETLPQKLREVLILRELEGLSYREIAEVTGSPTGTVMSRLSRARGGLKESLLNQSGAQRPPAAALADRDH